MEKKLGKIVSGVSGNARNLLDKAKDITIQAVDQNSDGKFDLEDVSMITENVGDVVKKGACALKVTIDEEKRQLELKKLNPIFAETLRDSDFVMPKFIRITERDKKHAESEVCKNSIGFGTNQKEMFIVNVFRDSLDEFELSFYPNSDSEFYYVDPSDNNSYIALDEYFNYLKIARVSELQRIAQDLGAKHFKVTYKEEKTTFTGKKMNTKVNAKPVVTSEMNSEHETKQFSTIAIAAETVFSGHEPIKPTVKYLKYDPSIKGLIDMRMNEQTPCLHQTYMLKLSNTSGLKENDAIKIDAVLKGLKCTGNATVVSEVQNESRRYLEYEIDF